METVLLASTACLLAATGWQVIDREWAQTAHGDSPPVVARAEADAAGGPVDAASVPPLASQSQATIQVALILDTSSSMDGLIDQARKQLWSVVNALDSATFQGGRPRLEIAIYEYGNDALEAERGYVRQVSGFSAELDIASESLFALTTSGGDEYAGEAIARAVDDLEWRSGDNVLRVVYIAGNESFAQGPLSFREAITSARRGGIVVNTINCAGAGDLDEGWREAAALGGGKSLRIDQDSIEVYRAAPQDDEIAALGLEINDTYVAYGAEGTRGLTNIVTQDNNSAKMGGSSAIERSLSKSSGYYRNPGWDLVDAVRDGEVAWQDLSPSEVPDALQGLDEQEVSAFLASKGKQRDTLKSKLRALQKERVAFLRDHRAEDDAGAQLEAAIVGSIAEQARAAGFTLDVS